ncbi:MAG: TIGR00303 family protein [Synergistaceae bacterium]|jgi:uncharacterized protein (TIGR00303 family)|nr:TIGR00303 family protein [Synergistaceae bacterium]
MFLLFISGTDLSKIPGLSAAGSNLDVLPLTSPADADVIRYGFPKAIDCFPMDPEGHPTPAIITRAAIEEAGIPVCVVRAGAYLPPAPPYVELGASHGRDARVEPAVADAREIFERASSFASNAAPRGKHVMLAESIPGGTTTALLVLRALGYSGMVSSGGASNPVGLKEEVWAAASSRVGIKLGDLRNDPLRAVTELGDPMQAAVLGFAMGLPKDVELTLAGGTQMIAVAALIKSLGGSRVPLVATTKYVAQDSSSSFSGLAGQIGVETYIAPLDFSSSPHKGLADYEKGYVKEGVGAGGSVLYAGRTGVSVDRVIARANSIYERISKQNS